MMTQVWESFRRLVSDCKPRKDVLFRNRSASGRLTKQIRQKEKLKRHGPPKTAANTVGTDSKCSSNGEYMGYPLDVRIRISTGLVCIQKTLRATQRIATSSSASMRSPGRMIQNTGRTPVFKYTPKLRSSEFNESRETWPVSASEKRKFGHSILQTNGRRLLEFNCPLRRSMLEAVEFRRVRLDT